MTAVLFDAKVAFGSWLLASPKDAWPGLRAWLLDKIEMCEVPAPLWSAGSVYLLMYSEMAPDSLFDELCEAVIAFGQDFDQLEVDLEFGRLYDVGFCQHLPFFGYVGKKRDEGQFLPTRALRGIISYGSWVDTDVSYVPPDAPTDEHEHWFSVLSDMSGFALPVWYPLDAEPGQAITVFVGSEKVDWTHGNEGLVAEEVEPLICQWIARLGAGEMWVQELNKEVVEA